MGIHRQTKWIVPNMFDTWRDFNFSTDHEIPHGEYELFDGVYGDEKTLVLFDEGPHTHEVIKYLLEIQQITFYDIKTIKPVLHTLPAYTFKGLFEYYYEFVKDLQLPETVAKMMVCTFIGQLSKLTFKQHFCAITQDKHYADACYNLYTDHGFNTQYIDHIDNDLIVLLIQKITPNLTTATPVWNQFIEGGKILLSKTSSALLRNAPNAKALSVNTDSVSIQNPTNQCFTTQEITQNIKRKHHILVN